MAIGNGQIPGVIPNNGCGGAFTGAYLGVYGKAISKNLGLSGMGIWRIF